MGATVAAAAIGGAATLIGSKNAADSADAAIESAEQAAAAQLAISQAQLDMAQEQWDIYKTSIFPLEMEAKELGIDAQQLAKQRGERDFQIYNDFYAPLSESFAQDAMEGVDVDRRMRTAREQTDVAFDSAEDQMRRDRERRGVMTGSGADRGGTGELALGRAATQALGVTRASETAEQEDFNRKAVALGRQPLGYTPMQGVGSPGLSAGLGAAGLGSAGRTAYGAGQQYTNIGNLYGNAAGDIMSGGIQLGMQAYDLYNKYAAPAPAPAQYTGYNTGSVVPSLPPNANTDYGTGSVGWAEGGPVNMPPTLDRGYCSGGKVRYAEGGEVSGPPGVDQVPATLTGPGGETMPARLSDGEYVIPKDVVDMVGTNELDEIITRAREIKQPPASPNQLRRSGQ